MTTMRELTGTFMPPTFVTIGDEYTGKGPAPLDRHKDKQFLTNPPKRGTGPDAMFDKRHMWLQDKIPYMDKVDRTATDKVLGFLSSAEPNRAEFTFETRQESYKETLKIEKQMALKTADPSNVPDPQFKIKSDLSKKTIDPRFQRSSDEIGAIQTTALEFDTPYKRVPCVKQNFFRVNGVFPSGETAAQGKRSDS
eukprot:Rmarinus@m.20998